jgi:hypothetical protein
MQHCDAGAVRRLDSMFLGGHSRLDLCDSAIFCRAFLHGRDSRISSTAGRRFLLLAGGGRCVAPAGLPCSRSDDRRALALRPEHLDRDRHCRSLGFEEPILCVLPFPLLRPPQWVDAILESLSLQRPSERRRSAVADLCAGFRVVGAVRSGALAPIRIFFWAGSRLARSGYARVGRRRPVCWQRRCSCSAARRPDGCSIPAIS